MKHGVYVFVCRRLYVCTQNNSNLQMEFKSFCVKKDMINFWK